MPVVKLIRTIKVLAYKKVSSSASRNSRINSNDANWADLIYVKPIDVRDKTKNRFFGNSLQNIIELRIISILY